MDAKDLGQYGFLGPIVGIAGLLIGAGSAILFGWTRTLDTWKPPPDVLPEPLSRMVTMLCAIGIFLAWIFAEPHNVSAYIRWVISLSLAGILGFLVYVALWVTCGRFRRGLVNQHNQPAGTQVIWRGFWKTQRARKAIREGATPEQFLAGNQYDKSAVWSAASLMTASVVTAFVLIAVLVCGTAALSTAATAAQVVLTGKPARQVFGTTTVPGLPAPNQAPAANQPPRKASP